MREALSKEMGKINAGIKAMFDESLGKVTDQINRYLALP